MKKLLLSLTMIVVWQSSGVCQGQQPREGYISAADGVRLFYKVVGSGTEVLIAVHGGPGNTMDSILPDLEPLAKSRTVIYYDQRGNGRSDLVKDREKLAISKHIEDLEAVRRYFRLEKMRLLGNSWGGILISAYAVAHPDRVERMILHNPGEPTKALLIQASDEIYARISSRYDVEKRMRFAFVANPQNWVEAKDPRAICREFFQLLLPTFVASEENISKFKGDVCAGSEEAVRYQQVVNTQIWRSLGDFNLLPSLGVIKAPVLVIHGEADPIPVKASIAWASAMPNARLLIIEKSGHISHVEQPEIFFSAVETFLKGSFPVDAIKVQPPAGKTR